MIIKNNRLMRDPDDKNKPADVPQDPKKAEASPEEGASTEQEPLIDKVKDALQEWSNKDQADQEFDDTRV